MVKDQSSSPPDTTTSPPPYDTQDPLLPATPTPPPKDKGSDLNGSATPRPAAPPRRQSSLATARPKGNPRTANRVRFTVEEHNEEQHANGNAHSEWLNEEDPMSDQDDDRHLNGSAEGQQRLPLLTGVEAPSVTLAGQDFDFDAEEHLEDARPKSGIQSAFMNMANSIM